MWVLRLPLLNQPRPADPEVEVEFRLHFTDMVYDSTTRTEDDKPLVDSPASYKSDPPSVFSLLVMHTCIFLTAKRTYGNATTGSMGFITSKSNRRKSYPSLSEMIPSSDIVATECYSPQQRSCSTPSSPPASPNTTIALYQPQTRSASISQASTATGTSRKVRA